MGLYGGVIWGYWKREWKLLYRVWGLAFTVRDSGLRKGGNLNSVLCGIAELGRNLHV